MDETCITVNGVACWRGLGEFCRADDVLAGVELMHLIRKGPFAVNDAAAMSFADQLYRWQDESVQCKPRSCSA